MSIKLNAQSGGSVALDAPTQTTNSEDKVYKLPVADGSSGQVLMTDGSGNLSWVTPGTATTNGITMVDRWHQNQNYSLSSAQTHYVIDNYWQRSSTVSSLKTANIGSAMTQSSGLFTFPSTGIYYIVYEALTGTSTDQLNMWSYITEGTSTSSTADISLKASSGDSGTMNTVTHSVIFDVTDVTTHKVFFRAYANTNGCYLSGSNLGNRTCVTFIRLGDT